ALELQLAVFDILEHGVLAVVWKIGERLATFPCLAGLVERREAIAIFLARAALRLSALILEALDEWRPKIVAFLFAVASRQLAVREEGRSRILAAGDLVVGRNDAGGQGLHGAAFVGREELPGTELRGRGRIAAVGLPRQRSGDGLRRCAGAGRDQNRGARK